MYCRPQNTPLAPITVGYKTCWWMTRVGEFSTKENFEFFRECSGYICKLV